jgi:hypothetical protein
VPTIGRERVLRGQAALCGEQAVMIETTTVLTRAKGIETAIVIMRATEGESITHLERARRRQATSSWSRVQTS